MNTQIAEGLLDQLEINADYAKVYISIRSFEYTFGVTNLLETLQHPGFLELLHSRIDHMEDCMEDFTEDEDTWYDLKEVLDDYYAPVRFDPEFGLMMIDCICLGYLSTYKRDIWDLFEPHFMNEFYSKTN